MLTSQILLVNPLNRAFRVEQNRSEIRRILGFEAGIDKISRVSAQHLGRALGNESEQTLLAASVRTSDHDDACAQSFSGRLAKGQLAKIQRRDRAPAIVKKSGKAIRSLGQLLQGDQRQDFHNPAGLEGIAIFAQLKQ